ncbi:MAG: SusC/RagA family protein, partial [Hymenobacter sp.]
MIEQDTYTCLHSSQINCLMKRALLLLLACCMFSIAWSQSRQIKGKVTDDKGTPIGGVSVIPKGSNAGTRTDTAGNFVLNVSTDKVELTFTYVGYTNQTVFASTSDAITTVQLTAQNSNLNDVVVIGYGTVKRKDLTGTVSSISGAQIEKVPVANVAEALTGRLPGVQVTTIDGQPGADIGSRLAR